MEIPFKTCFKEVLIVLFLSFHCLAWAENFSDVGAQEEGLEYLLFTDIPVVSVSFFETQPKQAPGYVTVVDFDRHDSPARSVMDVMEYFAPGVMIGRHDEAGPVLNNRGIMVDSNAKTLFMLDGMHLNHRQHFGYAGDMGSPLIGDIQSFEIINGPGAIVHGSGAISGFVNMISRNGTDNQGVKSKVEYGIEEELTLLDASYGMSYGEGRDLFLYFGWVQAEGGDMNFPWDLNDPGNNPESWTGIKHLQPYLDGVAEVNPNFIDDSYKASLLWNHDHFSLNVFVTDQTVGGNGYIYGGWGSNPAWNNGSIGFRPKYLLELSDTDSVIFDASVLQLQQGRVINETELTTRPKSYDSEAHYSFKTVYKTKRIEKQNIALGFSYGFKDFKQNDSILGNDSNGGTDEAATTEWDEWSLFGEDSFRLTEKWVTSVGIRYDQVNFNSIDNYDGEFYEFKDDSSDNTSLRVATAYEVNDVWNVKLSYQEGFRYLDAAYANYHIHFNRVLESLGYEALPDFKPETMESWELNVTVSLPDYKLKMDANFYINTYSDLLTWLNYSPEIPGASTAEAVTAVYAVEGWMGAHGNLVGEFKSVGGELIILWNPIDPVAVKFIYGYSKPDSVDDGAFNSINLFTSDKSEWTRYPLHSFKTFVEGVFLESKLKTSVNLIYQSGLDVDDFTSTYSKIYKDDRVVTDVSLSYALTENFTVKLIGKNIFECDVPQYTFNTPYASAMGQDQSHWYIQGKLTY